MKSFRIAALALGVLVVPASLALAQDYPSPNINPPFRYAPGAADRPIHGTHDKARAVREDNRNGMFEGRSTYEGYYGRR